MSSEFEKEEHHQHHILPFKMGWMVWGWLIAFTIITVAVAQIDLGKWNFFVAMIIATIKASLVVMFFMGLKYDNNENRAIFLCSFVFLAIFLVLTFSDTLFRPDDVVRAGDLVAKAGKSKFEKPWVAQPKIVEHGKQLFSVQCASCHGAEGKGDGVAAAALNPKPRNFTKATGWKNGRKPSQIFGTLTKGLNVMPSFGSMPAEDRWSLAHYVRTLGPEGPKDTVADLKAVGVDPTQKGGGQSKPKEIPVDLAIEILATDGSY